MSNNITYSEESGLQLSVDEWLVNLSKLFDDKFYVININTRQLEQAVFSYDMKPTEDMSEIIISVHNNLDKDKVYTNKISVDFLSNMIYKSFRSGNFLANTPDMYGYLSQLALNLYDENLHSNYIMLADLINTSVSVVYKNNSPMIIASHNNLEDPFYTVSLDNAHIYLNYLEKENYFTFYEDACKAMLGQDPNSPQYTCDFSTSAYKFVFFSPKYEQTVELDTKCCGEYFAIKDIEFTDNKMKQFILDNQRNPQLIMNAVIDDKNKDNMTDFLSFLD